MTHVLVFGKYTELLTLWCCFVAFDWCHVVLGGMRRVCEHVAVATDLGEAKRHEKVIVTASVWEIMRLCVWVAFL